MLQQRNQLPKGPNEMTTPAQPAIPLTDPRFTYKPSDMTDVRATWALFGWTPTPQTAKEPKNA